MTRIGGSTVLVTGGAIGIGRLMAERFLQLGAERAVLWDINEQTLGKTASTLRELGYAVDAFVVDVADPTEIRRTACTVRDEIGPVDILVNNAGIVVGKPFAEHGADDIEKSIRINVLGAMHVTSAFLPGMIERRRGHIVNVASAAGLLPNPNMSVYASSKWAVLGWSESLRLELQEMTGDLHVTTVTPSYINTGMFDGVKAPLLTPIMEPDTIVEAIVSAVGANRILVREPFMVKLLPLLRGIMPARVFDLIAGRVFGVYTSMVGFKGRPREQAVPDRTTLAASGKRRL